MGLCMCYSLLSKCNPPLCLANFYMTIRFQLSCSFLMDAFADSQSWARFFCYMLQRTTFLLLFEFVLINSHFNLIN